MTMAEAEVESQREQFQGYVRAMFGDEQPSVNEMLLALAYFPELTAAVLTGTGDARS